MLNEFPANLVCCLDRAATAYLEYKSHKGAYIHAKELRRLNGEALAIIDSEEPLIGKVLASEFAELKKHLGHWSALWDELDASKDFNDKDEFVFLNYVTFPSEAYKKIEKSLE